VVTLDTNVVVRLLVGDDPAQTPIAERAFLEHTRGDGVFVPIVVLVETSWVLARGYQLSRAIVHERLDRLARTQGVTLESPGVVLEALVDHANGTADFADYVLRASASSAGALPVLTFDRKLAREEDVELLRAAGRHRG
jgi:predicted nucleic-acid-binding protein